MLPRALLIGLLSLSLAAPNQLFQASLAWANQQEDTREALYKARFRNLNLAVDFANEAPGVAHERLAEAIESLYPFAPEISASPQAQAKLRIANLTLARSLLHNQLLRKARYTLRELYSVDPPRSREVEMLGPTLAKYGRETREKVDRLPRGQVEVNCAQPCYAYLNERRVSLVSELPAGEYRLFVQDRAGDTPSLQKRIELRAEGSRVRVRFDNPVLKSAKGGAPQIRPRPVPRPSAPRKRLLALWVEITGVTLGAAALGTGIWLTNKERTSCVGPKADSGDCLYDRSYKKPGVGLLVGGGVLLTTSIIMLVIDQNRHKSNRASKLAELARGQIRF